MNTKAITFSILGHILFLGFFSVSFGPKIPEARSANVYFWGQLLRTSQVSAPLVSEGPVRTISKPQEFLPVKLTQEALENKYFLKPQAAAVLSTNKVAYVDRPATLDFLPRRREPSIIFHPLLPYSFVLYFQDRQIAHVELDFNIASSAERLNVYVKRKISSGNLEVDLLSMRYISRYLATEKRGFTPNKWQTVKIDLSAKND